MMKINKTLLDTTYDVNSDGIAESLSWYKSNQGIPGFVNNPPFHP